MIQETRPRADAAGFRAAVSQAGAADALATLLIEERERLKEANQRAPQGVRACRALSEATDQIIQRLLHLALPEDPVARDPTRGKIAVVATGGYGRRELCPYSDIDVTFIVGEEEDPHLDATVRQMFHSLMEVFSQRVRLKVGYGYRTLTDVAQLDHQTQTALLDTRVISGSNGLTNQFLLEVFRHIWPAGFVRRKVAERREVIEKAGGTIYRIEPEVREGPGGLRDLHLAEWLAAVSFPSTRGDVWRQLQRLGVLTRKDVQDVVAAREFLLTVRNWMHWHTGRSADSLVRERQELVAEALLYHDDDRASRVERFMEQYYEYAERVDRSSGFVIDRCLTERLSLTDELVCSGKELFPAYPWVRVAEPAFLVDMCRHFQELGLTPGHELRRMIAQHVESCPPLGPDPEASDDFIGLLRAQAPPHLEPYTPHSVSATRVQPGVYDTLALMAELQILQRLIPELGEAYRRVPFDQVHRHTIGFHSLQTVRALEQLRITDDERLKEFTRIWADVDNPELLFLAGLLHDVGKIAPGSHSRAGAEMGRTIAERLGLDGPSVQKISTLIRHHLLMSETAQLADLTLEKSVQDFVGVIDSLDLLNMLLLLTYADMEATGVLSSMRIRFLEDLYFRAEAQLSVPERSATPEAPEDRARRYRSRLSRRLTAANLSPEQIKEHTEAMPVSYLLNTRPEQIATDIRMIESLAKSGAVVEFENEPGTEISTLHLCTLERPEPGLLSLVAGVLYAHEVSVYGAQVFTRGTEPKVALDTLWVDFHGRVIPPLKRLELEQDLVNTLSAGNVESVITRYRKQLPRAVENVGIHFDGQVAEIHTVVRIEAEDQPALLYRITRAMAALGWDIHSARISTTGDRAKDAFYVTTREGGKLEGDESALQDQFMAEFTRDIQAEQGGGG